MEGMEVEKGIVLASPWKRKLSLDTTELEEEGRLRTRQGEVFFFFAPYYPLTLAFLFKVSENRQFLFSD